MTAKKHVLVISSIKYVIITPLLAYLLVQLFCPLDCFDLRFDVDVVPKIRSSFNRNAKKDSDEETSEVAASRG